MPESMIVSGYCSCGFPASVRCPKCLVKLCGNCLPMHKCVVPLTEPKPVRAEPVATPEDNQSEAVREMTRKPGRPKVRK